MPLPARPLPDLLRAGDMLADRYRLVRPLGEGGMGVVWEARQVTTGKSVAVKILKGSESADAARFLREAKVLASFSHRNIVQVFDFWKIDSHGPPFMVMELLAGETLAERVTKAGRLSDADLLRFLLPVAAALRAAHAQGVVHRDLKPENIFLSTTSDGDIEVKVLDFGLARSVAPDMLTTAVTNTGSVAGTPFYMAPEQLYGEKDIDVRVDIWAFGVVLYECIAGTRPFGGDNLGQLLKQVAHGAQKPLREVAPSAPPALDALIGRMLSHDRDARPSIGEVWEALSNPSIMDPAPPPVLTSTRRMPSQPPPSLADASPVSGSGPPRSARTASGTHARAPTTELGLPPAPAPAATPAAMLATSSTGSVELPAAHLIASQMAEEAGAPKSIHVRRVSVWLGGALLLALLGVIAVLLFTRSDERADAPKTAVAESAPPAREAPPKTVPLPVPAELPPAPEPSAATFSDLPRAEPPKPAVTAVHRSPRPAPTVSPSKAPPPPSAEPASTNPLKRRY